VPALNETLAELRRILRPGGRLLFIEHVAAPRDSWLYTLQHGIEPVWRRLADGCHPDRNTGAALETAGFSSVDYERFATNLPVVSPHIMGTAVK
jgi:ubiquinone/menaquinone biosynthesis C-methylase UbiE